MYELSIPDLTKNVHILSVNIAIDKIIVQEASINLFLKLEYNVVMLLKLTPLRKHFQLDPKTKILPTQS